MSRPAWVPERLVLLAILLLAVALRLHALEAQSLWNDEGTSVALASRDLATITRNASQDIHPPLYYYALHAWMGLFGDRVGAVRSLSVVAGVGAVVAIYALSKRLFSPTTALLATLLTAVSPFQVYYSQETRMYALASLLGLLGMLAWVRLLDGWAACRGHKRAGLLAVVYVLLAVLSVYTHYFGFAILLAQNIGFLAWLIAVYRPREEKRRGKWGLLLRWALLQIIIVASYVPWLVLSWASLSGWPAVTERLTIPSLACSALETFALGVTYEDSPLARTLSLAAMIPCAICLVWAVWPRRRVRSVRRPLLGTWLALLYATIPVIIIYLVSLRRPMYKPKFLLLAMPGFAALQARGVGILSDGVRTLAQRRWAGTLVSAIAAVGLLAISTSSLRDLYTNPRYFRDDYEGIVQYIEATAGPDDVILINAPGQIETVDYYYDGPLAMVPLPMQRPIDTRVTEKALQDLVPEHPRIYGIFWAADESDPDRFIETWLDQHTFKTLDSWYGNVRLVVYAIPREAPDSPEKTVDWTLGETVRLMGYAVTPTPVSSGDILQLTLFWECVQPMDDRFKAFVHLVDARGNIIAQRDSEPVGGGHPTTSWNPGESIVDPYGLLVLPGTPPGEYLLRVGLYGAQNGLRLSVQQHGQAAGDAIDLVEITVERPRVQPPIGALGIDHPQDARWDGLRLLGHNLYRLGFDHAPKTPLHAGDPAKLILFWQREDDSPTSEVFMLALRNARGEAVWEHDLSIAGGAYPPEKWEIGEILRDAHEINLPSALIPGTYSLVISPAESSRARECRLQRLSLVP